MTNKSLTVVVLAALATTLVQADEAPVAGPAAAGPAPAAQPAADPARLPGDRVFPRGMHFPPPPAGASGGKPPPEPGSDAPGPSLALALEAAQAALNACKHEGYNVGVAVVDSTGQPRVTLAADGATGGHVYTGVRKSLTALHFGQASSIVAKQAESDASVSAQLTASMAPMGGAVPLKSKGQVIGALGVSGASSAQDEQCALAGADSIRTRL